MFVIGMAHPNTSQRVGTELQKAGVQRVVLGAAVAVAVAPQTIDGLSSMPCASWMCRMSKAFLQPHGGRTVTLGANRAT
jgi:hypothetical protein